MVDPEGAQIEASLISGEAEWVASVACRHGDETLPALRVEGLEAPFYRVAMADFQELAADAPEPSTFTMIVTDKAGNTHAETCSVVLATTELTITPQLLECGTSASVPLIYPETKPLLRLHAARDVDVEVSAMRTDKDEAITVTKVREGDDYRLTIVGPQEAYKANLTVKARDSRVYHADKLRGTATQVVPFQYETAKPALLVTEATAGRVVDPSKPLEAPRIVTNQDQVSLVLRRDNLVEMTIWIECELDGQPMPIEDPLVELHSEAEKAKVFKLPVDGQYSFSFATYRRGSERTQPPESAPRVIVARDTSEPSIAFLRAPRDLLQAPDDALLTAVQVDGRDDATKLIGHLTGPVEHTLELRLPAGAPAQTDLSFEQLGLQLGSLADGDYRLELVAVDAAGNEGKAEDQAFVVAMQGPSLRLASPGSNNRWDKEGDQFTLKIQGEDENGIAAVECRLTADSDKSTGWLAMDLVDDGDPRKGEWRRDCILSSMWSGQRVKVAWRGKDAYGNLQTEQTVDKVLPTFEAQLRPRVWNTPPAGEPVSMRVVRGAFDYIYGGRGRGSERPEFAKADLLLDDLGLRFVPSQEDVGDFYLDENEVTIARYLSFLNAEDGYQNAAHWREAAPDARRREQLIERLARSDARLPVTGLDWHECSAYAAWSGKRLPTAVEWEYAARGGAQYRAFSCVGAGFDRDQLAVGVPGPWPVEDGCDRVPSGVAEGVRNLCSNVAEWVAASGAGRCYSAGASYQDGQYHFSILRPTEARDRPVHTGFRCAVNADVVRSQLETGTSLRFSSDATSTSATKDR
ncbi:MAG: SUMF1/EgtB/PvdO family nonheme iron enzyme [Planctomycetota bacterium]|nr:SUMF1/EgtB/PvdO family nonheme iron enzyme [Planctomycetota bacterium]